MMNHLKVVEFREGGANEGSRYFEVAAQVRALLQCEYAIIATAEGDSLTVRAIAGANTETSGSLAVDLLSKLRDWGPVVVDDSRLVAVPVTRGQRAVGLILGYSSKPGTFNSDDLGKLTIYSHVVSDILDETSVSPLQRGTAAHERSECKPDRAQPSSEGGRGSLTLTSPPSSTGETRSTFTNDELLHLSRLITIGELSACFAHEVVNPLMLIRGHLRFLDETLAYEDPLRISYEVIDRASRRIEEMARRMLDFSRKRTPRLELCDIAEVLSDTLRFMQPYFQGDFVDVQIRLEPGIRAIHLDRWHMVQALVNLLQNASDAMADCDRRVLSITGKVEGDYLKLTVSDTGTGINPADLSRIFNPFFTTKGERGTGLGLYITKRVVEEHKGDIKVEPSSRGTTFVISLPL